MRVVIAKTGTRYYCYGTVRGSELRALREKRGVRAAWLADKLKLARRHIYKIESKKDVTVDEFVSYVSGLDMKPGDLLDNSGGVTPSVKPILDLVSTFQPDTLTQTLRIVEGIAAIAGAAAPESAKSGAVVPFQRKGNLRIILSDVERDELTEAVAKAAAGVLSPRTVGRSDVSVPMLAAVAADPQGRVSFKRMYETRDINSYHWDRGVRSVMSVEGDSMLDMAIATGDLLYIKPTVEPRAGRAIVCTVGNTFYVKVFDKREDGAIVLSSRNKVVGYPDIVIQPDKTNTFNYLGEVFGRYGDL